MMRPLLLVASHAAAAALGFALGIYVLPILTAPPPPDAATLTAARDAAMFSGEFRRDLAGSDALHWGEGRLFVGPTAITLEGEIAPGPAYRLYLSPVFVESEAAFAAHRADMIAIGDVKTFRNFSVAIPAGVDVARYTTAIVWCEAFSQFITAARYR